MATFSVYLGGFQEMIDTLNTLGDVPETRKIINKAMKEGAKPVLAAMKRKAPVYKGAAHSSLKQMRSTIPGFLRDSLKVGSVDWHQNTCYAAVGVTRGDITEAFYGKFSEYGSSHEPAKPWMRPAFDETRGEAYQIIEQVILDAIETSFKK